MLCALFNYFYMKLTVL